ncbi:MAG: adenosylcobinamide amidohydrolase [Actinomycetota bacterium]
MTEMALDPPEYRPPGRHDEGVLRWRVPEGVESLASAPVGGGRTRPRWMLNIRVPMTYDRTDLDAHASEVAAGERFDGPGIALFTAASVERHARGAVRGATVDATVGVSKPTWAADETGGHERWSPGTINLVAFVPAALSEAAAVNLVMTMTEAKTQALLDRGVPGTGTASDAVVVLWPTGGDAEPFGGPRSRWGSRVARATHDAVLGAMPS